MSQYAGRSFTSIQRVCLLFMAFASTLERLDPNMKDIPREQGTKQKIEKINSATWKFESDEHVGFLMIEKPVQIDLKVVLERPGDLNTSEAGKKAITGNHKNAI